MLIVNHIMPVYIGVLKTLSAWVALRGDYNIIIQM